MVENNIDMEQLYQELDNLVEDYVSGIISEKEFQELQLRIKEDLDECLFTTT